MLKLLAALAALTFVSACTTTGTLTSDRDTRAGTATMGAGPSVRPLGSGGPGLDGIYLPG